ncbi:MAG: S8 family serine peptidase [Candidatus Diapherotrites archaeon]|uniref:S8 family serine peptidase n=1 Tax=Candidatus Iainarchaeum sp. TaxID=3101447 RepID=A0A939C4W8_9ARCH|nr:S8 family serine peptidase [Candidatus Diapherotrites archaeon]
MVKGKVFFGVVLLFFLISISFCGFAQELTPVSPPVEGTVVTSTPEEIAVREQQELENPTPIDFPYQLCFTSGGCVTPTKQVDDRLQARIEEASEPSYTGKEYTYGFIMVEGKITWTKLEMLRNLGIEITGGSHSYNALPAKIPFDKVSELKDLTFVKWIGYANSAQKLDIVLKKTIEQSSKTQPYEEKDIFIHLFDEDSNEFREDLHDLGIQINKYYPTLKMYSASTPLNIIPQLLGLDFVYGLEEDRLEPGAALDRGVPQISGDYMIGDSYDGTGTKVGVIDAGYEAAHLDLPDYSYCNDFIDVDGNCMDSPDDKGHGSHVAGIIFGRGTASDGKYMGMAPGVTDIKIARVLDVGFSDSDLIDAMNWMAQSPAANVVNISLGHFSTDCNGVDALSREVDSKTYYENQVYVIAAGNEGDLDSNQGHIRQPACSKNAITIGALYASNYTDGNTDDIWYKSSQGDTEYGRVKPDIAAPGCAIWSPKWNTIDGYTPRCGTSMAAPIVTGLIAGLMQIWSSYKDAVATFKASLMASAMPNGGEASAPSIYGRGKVDSYLTDYDYNIANGWTSGRLVPFVLNYNDDWRYTDIVLPEDVNRLVILLTWVEPPANYGDYSAVLHNLNLYLDKEPFDSAGNSYDFGWKSESIYDNVEKIIINTPSSGKYRIKAYAEDIDGSYDPPKASFSWYVIRGDPTPSYSVDLQPSSSSVLIDENFEVTATVTPGSYIVSSPWLNLTVPGGVDKEGWRITKKEGTTIYYPGSDTNISIGDIPVYTDREAIWTLQATTAGQKTIEIYSDSDNGGIKTDSTTVTAYYPNDHSCSSNSECYSDNCSSDFDGSGKWCCASSSCAHDGTCYSSGQKQCYGNIVETCSSGSWQQEDCTTKDSTDSDGGNFPLLFGQCFDYTTCSGGACTGNQYDDTCTLATALTEYFNVGASYSTQGYDCNDFEAEASDSYGDDPSYTEACTGGTGAGCSSGQFSTAGGASGTDYCEGTCGTGTDSCYFVEYYPADSGDSCPGLDTCTSTTYGADTEENTCSECKGAGYWDLGGDVSQCCGDDSGEYKKTRACDAGVCDTNSSDAACCSESSKCVYNNTCYEEGYGGDVDGDSVNEHCSNGTWIKISIDYVLGYGGGRVVGQDYNVMYSLLPQPLGLMGGGDLNVLLGWSYYSGGEEQGSAEWWNTSWANRRAIQLPNQDMNRGTTIQVAGIDFSSLDVKSDLSDVRIVDENTGVELDRVCDGSSSSTDGNCFFFLNNPISQGQSDRDTTYYLYYNNSGAGSPPTGNAARTQVCDFEGGRKCGWSLDLNSDVYRFGSYSMSSSTATSARPSSSLGSKADFNYSVWVRANFDLSGTPDGANTYNIDYGTSHICGGGLYENGSAVKAYGMGDAGSSKCSPPYGATLSNNTWYRFEAHYEDNSDYCYYTWWDTSGNVVETFYCQTAELSGAPNNLGLYGDYTEGSAWYSFFDNPTFGLPTVASGLGSEESQ